MQSLEEKNMKTLNDSVNALALLLIVSVAAAILVPLVSRGQSQNASRRRDLRRFYLTQTPFDGSQALSACAAGHHMASLWEILDVSNLQYDTSIGFIRADSGLGPPTLAEGWVRTGASLLNEDTPGIGSCQAYTTTNSNLFGTSVNLPQEFNSTAITVISPWESSTPTCDQPVRVWCVQD
jgi:hypothetical protein